MNRTEALAGRVWHTGITLTHKREREYRVHLSDNWAKELVRQQVDGDHAHPDQTNREATTTNETP